MNAGQFFYEATQTDSMLETALEVTVGDGVAFEFSVVNAGDTPI
ncbi:MAG: hypothetical protein ACI9TI_002566, partial [Natronomonas sp.]